MFNEIIMTIKVICIYIRIIYFLFSLFGYCTVEAILIRSIWSLKHPLCICITIQSENHIIACLINYSLFKFLLDHPIKKHAYLSYLINFISFYDQLSIIEIYYMPLTNLINGCQGYLKNTKARYKCI